MVKGIVVNDLYLMPGHLIRRLQQAAVAVVISKLTEHGYDLTPVQFAALKTLSLHPGIDQASLAGLIAYDRTTIGGVIDRLEQKGFVERGISRTDRRARILTLTEAGKSVLLKVEPLVKEVQQEILCGLPENERSEFVLNLQRCVDALNDRTRIPRKAKTS